MTSSHMRETEAGGDGYTNSPISNTLQNRSALLRAISTTERLRKRQEQEQREEALCHPSIHSSVGQKSKSPLMRKYRQPSMSSALPVSSTSLAYSSYPVNASYPSSLGRLVDLPEIFTLSSDSFPSFQYHTLSTHPIITGQ